MTQIWKSNLPSTPKLVALRIADSANGECEAWVSLQTIINETGVGKRTVTGSLTLLKKQGILSWYSDKKRGVVYRLDPSKICYETLAKSAKPSVAKSAKVKDESVANSASNRSKICYESVAKSATESQLYILENPQRTPKNQKHCVESDANGAKDGAKNRPRDLLFDAIAEVCCLDISAQASLIGKAKSKLVAFDATADEVKLFGKVFAKQHPFKQVPKWTDLTSQFGIIRNAEKVKAILGSVPAGEKKTQAYRDRIVTHDPSKVELLPADHEEPEVNF